MTDSIHRSNQNHIPVTGNKMLIARLVLAGKNESGNTVLDEGHFYCFHFFTTTVVPWPGWDLISNSSIRRRTPGNPIPRLPEVEKPSRSACRMSGIPGPSSEAMTERP